MEKDGVVSGSVPDPTPLTPTPLRPRVHTYTGSQWPFRSVKKVPRALLGDVTRDLSNTHFDPQCFDLPR